MAYDGRCAENIPSSFRTIDEAKWLFLFMTPTWNRNLKHVRFVRLAVRVHAVVAAMTVHDAGPCRALGRPRCHRKRLRPLQNKRRLDDIGDPRPTCTHGLQQVL